MIPVPDRGSGSLGGWLPDDLVGSERIRTLFSAMETRVIDETTQNGTTYYRIVGTDVTDDPDLGGRWEEPRNATLRATIGSRGLVRQYRLRYDGTVNGTPVTVVRRVRYTEIGSTSVKRPPWYEAAVRNATTATPDTTDTTNVSAATTSIATAITDTTAAPPADARTILATGPAMG